MAITLAQINDAIAGQLQSATGLNVTQSYNELTEGVVDFPLLQVYWQTSEPVTENDRKTFAAGRRVTRHIFNADLYARPRSQIDEDMAEVLTMANAIIDRLEAQTVGNFGLAGVKAFHWSSSRVQFTYADGATPYSGVRFVITVWTF